ncbi:MAG: RagB/SusD family nutrient uptake outer membrane protein [Lewinellaceae bacterium]|nr:RagB/SusD family nutrient uptake outer membrane protein [Saprospiraceae bacterium]MCB9330848.1 RagB/SusD family nutrient uptake outer membrane protein [Lewinellaceae bacterium]
MNFKHSLSVLLLLFLSSCSKEFLEIPPVDRLTADNFYRNASDVRAATAALYGVPWFDFNDKFFWLSGDCMSGNMYYTYDQEGQFFYFSFTPGNAHLSAGWRGVYRVVSYANSIINDMPRIASGNGISQDVIDAAIAEARFMRGTAYYLIAEYWGEAPIVENAGELVAANNLILPKNTKANLYEFARRDLAYASETLPASDNPGRVTKWSAMGMLAKLHLTMAQNLSDGNSAANFTKAKDYAGEVIETSGLSLMTNYADLFKIENNNNPESLFALQWMEGSYAFGNSRQANWARSSLVTGNTECWGGAKCASYDFVQEVEPNDKRQPAIFMAPGNYYPEINKAAGGYTYNIVTRDPVKPDVVVEGAAPLLNNIKKYIVGSANDTGDKVSTGQATAINQYMLRLADVYLVYAEAVLGAGNSTSDSKALQYFNAVRTRGGLTAKSAISFTDILHERRVEFCMESLFWFDLKRYFYRDTNGALAFLNGQERENTYYRDQSPNAADENTVAGYILQTQPPLTITAAQMTLPIPAAEVVANPKLAPGVPAEEYPFN